MLIYLSLLYIIENKEPYIIEIEVSKVMYVFCDDV